MIDVRVKIMDLFKINTTKDCSKAPRAKNVYGEKEPRKLETKKQS